MDIIPALLEYQPEELLVTVNKLTQHYKHFQLDIVDGELYPQKTIQIEDIRKTLKLIDPPTLRQLTFDFDLMVRDYMSYIENIEEIEEIVKIETIFVRANLIGNYKKLADLYPEISIGLVVDPADSIETIAQAYDLENIPVIQIMTVAPGAQGHPFQEDMLTKIEQLRMLDYRNKIYIDGGINEESLKIISSKKYRPDTLCIGSYLTHANKLEEKVKKLQTLTL